MPVTVAAERAEQSKKLAESPMEIETGRRAPHWERSVGKKLAESPMEIETKSIALAGRGWQ